MKFYNAWNYLNNHVIFENEDGFSMFQECLDMEVVKVDPDTNSISDNEEENTSTRIWLECGPYQKDCRTHDINLDCGAKTFEKAIKKLAKKVKKVYGDDREKALNLVKEKYENKGYPYDNEKEEE